MKTTYRILSGILSAVLVLGLSGCGSAVSEEELTQVTVSDSDLTSAHTDHTTSSVSVAAPEIPADPVTSLEDVPAEHRPEVSDPKAAEAHGVSMTATYSVPNGVIVSIAASNGADTMKMNLSLDPVFERYEAGGWVPMEGQETVNQAGKLGDIRTVMPMNWHFAMPTFPETGVYRCVILMGDEVRAEHYAYFEVPEYTMTVPTEAECPPADSEEPPLIVTAKDVTNQGLTLVLRTRDGGKTIANYGYGYSLACHVNGAWEPVAMYDGAFIAVGIVGGVDGEREVRGSFVGHHYPIPAGHYRYARRFGAVTYYVYFEIDE